MSDDNEQLRADLARVTTERDEAHGALLRCVAERDALRDHVRDGANTTLVILRRVRDALRAFGVADCDDPIDALEAVAADVPRRESEATDEYNAAMLRAHAEGRAAGLREALAIAREVESEHNGSGVASCSVLTYGKAYGAGIVAGCIEELLAKGGGA